MQRYFSPRYFVLLLLSFLLTACVTPRFQFEQTKGLYAKDISVRFDEHLQYFYSILSYAKLLREQNDIQNKWLTFSAGALTAAAALNGAIQDQRSDAAKNNDTAKITFAAAIASLAASIFKEDNIEPSEDIGRFESMLASAVRRKNDITLEFALCSARLDLMETCEKQREEKISILILELKDQCGALFGDMPEVQCFPEKLNPPANNPSQVAPPNPPAEESSSSSH